MYKHILVPTDGSLLSARTVSSAVELAREVGARVTFLYVEPDDTTDLYGEAALWHSMAPEQFEEKYRLRARAILSKAEAVAEVAQVPCNCISCIGNSPHEVILKAAEQESCDLVYMSSRGRGGAGGMMIGSETLKTLIHAKVPVLVFSVGANAPASAKSLSVIQDEHQSIAAVMKRLQALVAEVRRGGAPPDVATLRQIVSYFRDFPAKYHHPKEDDYLFALLSKRTHEMDETIAELRAQHLAEHTMLADLEVAINRLEKDPDASIDVLVEAVDRFANHTWTHMTLEESVVFPAAQKYLTDEDWDEIESAFRGNVQKGFADVGARLVRSAFARIVNVLDH